VLVSLPSLKIVEDTILDIAAGGRTKIIVDLSTSGPQLAIRLAEELGARSIASFDAPVSGGVKGAREGTLSLMASGPETEWETVRPLLERLGKPFYMGAQPGAGQTMKLVNNLLGAVAIAVTAEGMAMGVKAGLDPARMIEVLNQSTGRNSATADKWPRSVLPRTFDFGFAATLSLKDTRLLMEEAAALGVPLPHGSAVLRLLERTVETYGEGADFTAMARIAEADAGLEP
jgi:3-hydroxyisobutyrate dehydrogenase-like beta-hydroxyacid dehydrogenase